MSSPSVQIMQLPKDKKSLGDIVRSYIPNLSPYEEQYMDFHQHPELGNQESRTSSIVEKHLKTLEYEVHTCIGGYGLVGVLKNGSGKTVLLRADMDALPIKEETDVPYSSQVHQTDDQAQIVPVMHACGHDMHITCLMAIAELLRAAKSKWSGTLICLFQPSEEKGTGAKTMVNDGLYERIPIPDIILGQHTIGSGRAGRVRLRSGPYMSAADSFVVKIHGRGGHGSMPHASVDPIVISSHIIVKLQTVVSRMVDPREFAVVTCGSIHAGNSENAIPDSAELKLDIRTFDPTIRQKVVRTVKDIIRAECSLAGCPRQPEIKQTREFPLTVNDGGVVERISGAMVDFFGQEEVEAANQMPASEDVSNLARPYSTPMAFWHWGTMDHDRYDDAENAGTLDEFPSNHSGQWAPVIQPSLKSGVEALSLAALCFLA